MPTPAPLLPQESSLDRMLVRRPVSSRHGARWVSQIAHLLGRQTHRVCSCALQVLTTRTANAKPAKVAYCRSPSAKLAIVAIELRYDRLQTSPTVFPSGYLVTVNVTAPTGAVWVDRGPPEALLDGSVSIGLPSPTLSGRRWLTGILDVSACSTTTVSDMTVEIAGVGTNTHEGLGTITLVEVPRGSLAPESGETGLQLQWCDPRNWLEEGPAVTGPRGMSALLDIERLASEQLRWWWQLVGYEQATPGTDTWARASSTIGAINWRQGLGTLASPVWQVRARSLYGTSAGMAVEIRVRYHATGGGTVRVIATPVGGVASNLDVICPAGAGWQVATLAAVIPATGSGQLVEIEIQAKATSGTLYLSQVAIRQTEACVVAASLLLDESGGTLLAEDGSSLAPE
jgi:hypothetical protein